MGSRLLVLCLTICLCSGLNGQAEPQHNFLPVVIHVVWHEEEENISDIQILSQLEVLNQLFDTIPYFHKIPDEFKPLAGNPNINFCLARQDPDGRPHSGIVRVQTQEADIASKFEQGRRKIKYDAFGGSDAWNTQRYINIWVGRFLGEGKNRLLGDATLPGEAPFFEEDGIVIDYRNFGLTGPVLKDGLQTEGKTLVHEMGHYLGLRHLSGEGGCQMDDGIDDTPVQSIEYSGCPSGIQESCGSSDMYMNFMSLTDDPCLLFFTQGQVQRMNFVVNIDRFLLGAFVDCSEREPTRDPGPMFYGPNPFSTQFYLSWEQGFPENTTVALFDVSGRELIRKRVSTRVVYLPAASLPPGIYFLRIETQGEKMQLIELIKPK